MIIIFIKFRKQMKIKKQILIINKKILIIQQHHHKIKNLDIINLQVLI